MRGSCSESAAGADLSRLLETVSEIERADARGPRVGEVGEAPVAAHPLLAPGSFVRLLDRERAAGERLARELEGPVALAALGLLEQPGVDLGREHLLRAAHVPD